MYENLHLAGDRRNGNRLLVQSDLKAFYKKRHISLASTCHIFLGHIHPLIVWSDGPRTRAGKHYRSVLFENIWTHEFSLGFHT